VVSSVLDIGIEDVASLVVFTFVTSDGCVGVEVVTVVAAVCFAVVISSVKNSIALV